MPDEEGEGVSIKNTRGQCQAQRYVDEPFEDKRPQKNSLRGGEKNNPKTKVLMAHPGKNNTNENHC